MQSHASRGFEAILMAVFCPFGAELSKLANHLRGESFSLREKVARAKREPDRASIKKRAG